MDKANISVLVVDYEPGTRSVLVSLLARTLGFKRANIFEASNAEQALEQLAKRKIKLLITGNQLDTFMREKNMTGVDLICKVKELHGQTKILMLSGGGKPDLLPPEVVFLQKPFIENKEFEEAIEKALI